MLITNLYSSIYLLIGSFTGPEPPFWLKFHSSWSLQRPPPHSCSVLWCNWLSQVSFTCSNFRLTTLSGCSDDQSDLSDLELIQHINVDVSRLTKLLSGQYQHLLLNINMKQLRLFNYVSASSWRKKQCKHTERTSSTPQDTTAFWQTSPGQIRLPVGFKLEMLNVTQIYM